MKSYEEIKKEMDDLKEKNDKLKAENRNLKYGNIEKFKKEEDLSKNYLQLFGYDGVKIPLDEEIKKKISEYIFVEMRHIIENDKDMEDIFVKKALTYKNAFVNIFTPVVREIIEKLDFNVTFNSEV